MANKNIAADLKDINCEVPNWKPLEDLNKYYPDLFHMNDFMWMQTVDGIECYKHRLMRNYINIDNNGNFWKYIDSRYVEVPILEAVRSLKWPNY